MKIKLLTSLAGDGFAHSPGEEIERSKDEAERLIAAGFALAVTEPKVERAVKVAKGVETR